LLPLDKSSKLLWLKQEDLLEEEKSSAAKGSAFEAI